MSPVGLRRSRVTDMFGLDYPKLKAQVTLQSARRTHSCFLGRFLLDGTQLQTSASGDGV